MIAIENARLFEAEQERTRELTESLQQQTATADVLKVISQSTFDLQAVLDTLVKSAVQLCDADQGHIARPNESGIFQTQAHFGFPTGLKEEIERIPFKPGRDSVTGRALLERTTVQIVDAQNDPEYKMSELQRFGGYRSMIGTPLLREGTPIGVFGLARHAVRPFTDKQMALLTTFADQAAIAIENVRLFEEVQHRTHDLSESLEQQTATAEVLKVISSSPGELEPVFDAILENAVQICGAKFGCLELFEGNDYRRVASHNAPTAYVEARTRDPVRPLATSRILSHVATTKQVIQLTDMDAEQGDIARLGGARTILCAPMLKDNRVVGAIAIYRQEVRPFTDKQTELVTNFSAQAVIAIENTRLLNELRESLQQQTATADVLKAISRSTFDLQTVLDTLVESATRLCNADYTWLFQREGEDFRWVASFGLATDVHARIRDFLTTTPVQVNRGSITGRVALEGRAIYIPDVLADPEYTYSVAQNTQKIGRYRAALGVPLLRQGEVVGVLCIMKTVPQPFTAKQIELATTFADQAVIAIENTRLLNELRESLRQQLPLLMCLRLSSSSPGELQPVFSAMLAKATDLCTASYGAMWLREQDGYRAVAIYGDLPQDYIQQLRNVQIYRPGSDVPLRRAIEARHPVQILDMRESASYLARDPLPVSAVEIAGIRTLVAVPMLKDNEPIGAIAIYREEVHPFSEKQIALLDELCRRRRSSPSRIRVYSTSCVNAAPADCDRRRP